MSLAAPDSEKGPRGPLKGPRGPLKGPRGPLKGFFWIFLDFFDFFGFIFFQFGPSPQAAGRKPIPKATAATIQMGTPVGPSGCNRELAETHPGTRDPGVLEDPGVL